MTLIEVFEAIARDEPTELEREGLTKGMVTSAVNRLAQTYRMNLGNLPQALLREMVFDEIENMYGRHFSAATRMAFVGAN